MRRFVCLVSLWLGGLVLSGAASDLAAVPYCGTPGGSRPPDAQPRSAMTEDPFHAGPVWSTRGSRPPDAQPGVAEASGFGGRIPQVTTSRQTQTQKAAAAASRLNVHAEAGRFGHERIWPVPPGWTETVLAEFGYDYQGRRVRKDGWADPGPAGLLPPEVRLYRYDETAVLAEYVPGTDGTLHKERQYLYGADLIAVEHTPEAAPGGSRPPAAQLDSPGAARPGYSGQANAASSRSSAALRETWGDLSDGRHYDVMDLGGGAVMIMPEGSVPDDRRVTRGSRGSRPPDALPDLTAIAYGPQRPGEGRRGDAATPESPRARPAQSAAPACGARGLPATSFYHRDALGSVVNLTGQTGQVEVAYLYDAWGNFQEADLGPGKSELGPREAPPEVRDSKSDSRVPTSDVLSPSPSNRLTYTGHEFDPETGLYYFKARYYDPALGRFASPDSFLGELSTPPSLHRYLYAYKNPLRYIDLTGYSNIDQALKALKSVEQNRAFEKHLSDFSAPGPPVGDIAAEAGRSAFRALGSTDTYTGAVGQIGGMLESAIQDPGQLLTGFLDLPAQLKQMVEGGLTATADLLHGWQSMSPAQRQARMDALAKRGITLAISQGLIYLTVKSAGKSIHYFFNETESGQLILSRIDDSKTTINLEKIGGAERLALPDGNSRTIQMKRSFRDDPSGEIREYWEPDLQAYRSTNVTHHDELGKDTKGILGESAGRKTLLRAGYRELPAKLPGNQGMDGVFV